MTLAHAPIHTANTAKRKRATSYADWGFIAFAVALMVFMYLPIAMLIIYSFNDSPSLTWPLTGFTTSWYQKLSTNGDLLEATGNSFYVASFSTLITLVVGISAAMALHKFNFPGKTVFRRLLLLPIALPGIVTGIAMLNLFKVFGFNLSLETVILGHATALLAVVVTQVFARLQRLPKSLEEASSDLGANGFQTFWYVTLPNIKTAVIGAGLLSFVLSFDEIPVTFFLTGRDNTLPMYIYSTMRRGITPEINAIGTLLIAVSVILIIVAVMLMRDQKKPKKPT